MSKFERYENELDDIETSFENEEETFDYLCGYSLKNDIYDVIDNMNYNENLRKFIKNNKDNIKIICDDIDHNIYTFNKNNELYINTDKQDIDNLISIVNMDRVNIIGITNDNRIITIIGFRDLTNNNETYKKIISTDGEVFALRNDGTLVMNIYVPRLINGKRLTNVEDIKYDEEDDIFVKQNDEWFSLFE